MVQAALLSSQLIPAIQGKKEGDLGGALAQEHVRTPRKFYWIIYQPHPLPGIAVASAYLHLNTGYRRTRISLPAKEALLIFSKVFALW